MSEQIRKDFRILVVDDELIVRESLQDWLEDEDFTVDMAASGPEALDLLSKQSYQLMLTDIKMPGMDGVELLQKAKEDFPDLCVVMMTAYGKFDHAVEATKSGCYQFVGKPFQLDEIKMVVRGALKNASLAREVEVLKRGAVGRFPTDQVIGESRGIGQVSTCRRYPCALGWRGVHIVHVGGQPRRGHSRGGENARGNSRSSF